MADPGRYLQCVRTLRDYAGKGCWEAQVCDLQIKMIYSNSSLFFFFFFPPVSFLCQCGVFILSRLCDKSFKMFLLTAFHLLRLSFIYIFPLLLLVLIEAKSRCVKRARQLPTSFFVFTMYHNNVTHLDCKISKHSRNKCSTRPCCCHFTAAQFKKF